MDNAREVRETRRRIKGRKASLMSTSTATTRRKAKEREQQNKLNYIQSTIDGLSSAISRQILTMRRLSAELELAVIKQDEIQVEYNERQSQYDKWKLHLARLVELKNAKTKHST